MYSYFPNRGSKLSHVTLDGHVLTFIYNDGTRVVKHDSSEAEYYKVAHSSDVDRTAEAMILLHKLEVQSESSRHAR